MITAERLKQLEEAEYKLRLLEAGGVNNWDGYSFAMEEFYKEKEKKEKLSNWFDEICEILSNGIEEPAGTGCGYGFREKTYDDASIRFNEILREFMAGEK